MGCILALLALVFPRFVLLLLAVFSHYLHNGFQTKIWPVLGFFFMPVTTLAYAWSTNTYGGVRDLGLVAVVVAVLIDFGLLGLSGEEGRKAKRRREE
jgi:hypothetical protein